jgi:plastocyanin
VPEPALGAHQRQRTPYNGFDRLSYNHIIELEEQQTMTSRTKLTLVSLLTLSAMLAVALGSLRLTQVAAQQSGPTTPTRYLVTAGWGNDDWTANIYTPQKLNIYVGDTVTWRVGGLLEPHTITFGPWTLLRKLAQNSVVPMPQKQGPPQLVLNPRFAFPTPAHSYAGMGFANSGFLTKGRSWSLTFTRPGIYRYYCLIHFPGMSGVVVVHPRPGQSHIYTVAAGYGSDTSAADAFFPDHLTIHVGDTVVWRGGFHTITFGPPALLRNLRQHLVVPISQKNGPPHLTLNPRVAFPSGGTSYSGSGLVNSGLLITQAHNSFRLTFAKAGVYHYLCLVHPGMDGTIRVLP